MLMRNDNIEWAEQMQKWERDPSNKKISVKGDDRSPAYRWIGALYCDGEYVVLPSDNLMTIWREGGRRCPTGKGQTTFKSQSQSGIVVNESSWVLNLDGGRTVKKADIMPLVNEPDFSKHMDRARELGFELFVKRAVVNSSKHIRVRPRFNVWSAEGTVTVFDPMITKEVFTNIVTLGGAYAGFGDWRPGAPHSPGPFGKFSATVKEI